MAVEVQLTNGEEIVDLSKLKKDPNGKLILNSEEIKNLKLSLAENLDESNINIFQDGNNVEIAIEDENGETIFLVLENISEILANNENIPVFEVFNSNNESLLSFVNQNDVSNYISLQEQNRNQQNKEVAELENLEPAAGGGQSSTATTPDIDDQNANNDNGQNNENNQNVDNNQQDNIPETTSQITPIEPTYAYDTTFTGDLTGNSIEDLSIINGQVSNSDPHYDEQTYITNQITGLYGTFSISTDGFWSYTLDNSKDEVQALAQGQIESESFLIQTAAGKASTTINITITGTNDAPVIDGADTVDSDETNAALTATDTMIISDVDTSDVVTASIEGLVVSGTSNRTDAAAPSDADLLAMLSITPTAILDGNENSDTLTWNFNSGTEVFDYLATGETLVLTYTVQATDDAGTALNDQETVTLTITGTNDAPVIDGADTVDLDETNAALTATDTMVISDVDTSDVVTASIEGLVVSGTSNRTDAAAPSDADLLAMLSITPTAILDGNENSDTLTWNFNSGTEVFDYLATGETLVLTYTVQATDDAGTALNDQETVTLTITGTNDAPVAEVDTGSGTENATISVDVLGNDTDIDHNDDSSNFTLNTTTITTNDHSTGYDASKVTTVATATIVNNQLEFNPGDEFDYLATGETATVVVTYVMQDNEGATSTATATLTITGTNDAPVINVVKDEYAELESSTGVNGDSLIGDLIDSTSITEIDLNDTHIVSELNGVDTVVGDNFTTVRLSYNVDGVIHNIDASIRVTSDGLYFINQSTLDEIPHDIVARGSLLYKVKDSSGTENAESENQKVDIEITGSNDRPIIETATASDVVEGVLTGNLSKIISDTDTADTHTFISGTVNAEIETNVKDIDDNNLVSGVQVQISVDGSYVVTGTGIENLGASEQVQISFDVKVTDGTDSSNAVSSTKEVTLNIKGTNDKPVIDSAISSDVEEGVLTGVITELVSDTDANDTYEFVAETVDATIITNATGDLVSDLQIQIKADGSYTVTGVGIENLGVTEEIEISFDVRIKDSSGDDTTNISNARAVTLKIKGANDKPTLEEIDPSSIFDTSSTDIFSAISGILEGKDIDTNDTLTYSINGIDSSDSIHDTIVGDYGTLILTVATGEYTYTPDADAVNALKVDDIETFIFKVNDGTENSDTQNLVFTIKGVNDTAVITVGGDDSSREEIKEDTNTETKTVDGTDYTVITATGSLSISDADTDEHKFDSNIIFQNSLSTNESSLGELIITADGQWDYWVDTNKNEIQTLGEDESITEVFEISSFDGTDSQYITVVINGTNDQPEVDVVTAQVDETAAGVSTSFTGNLPGVRETDTNDTHKYSLVENSIEVTDDITVDGDTFDASNITVTILNDGSYTISGNFENLSASKKATVTFQYIATDDSGTNNAVSEPKIVTLTINGTNDNPIVENITYSLIENELTVVDTDDSNPENENSTYTSSVSLISTNDLNDTHTYMLDPFSDIVTTGPKDSSDNDIVDPDNTTVIIDESSGSFTVKNADLNQLKEGEIAYIRFKYIAIDQNNAESEPKVITLKITGTNDAPVIIADSLNDATVVEADNGTIDGDLPVLIRDTHFTDIDTNDSGWTYNAIAAGTATIVTDVTAGAGANVGAVTVEMGADGAYTLSGAGLEKLATGEQITVEFDVTITDGDDNSAVETVTLTVTGTNDAPVIIADSLNDATVVEADNGTIDGDLPVLIRDTHFTDIDTNDSGWTYNAIAAGTATIVTDVTAGAGANVGAVTVEMGADGAYTLSGAGLEKLATGEQITVEFDVTITDGDDNSAVETVTLTVTGTNDAPVIDAGIIFNGHENSIDTINAIQDYVRELDTNDDVTITSARIVDSTSSSVAGSGEVNISTDNKSLIFDTNNQFPHLEYGESQDVLIEFTVDDGNGGTDTKTMTYRVNGNDAPSIEIDSTSNRDDNYVNKNELGGTHNNKLVFTISDLDKTNAKVGDKVILTGTAGQSESFTLDQDDIDNAFTRYTNLGTQGEQTLSVYIEYQNSTNDVTVGSFGSDTVILDSYIDSPTINTIEDDDVINSSEVDNVVVSGTSEANATIDIQFFQISNIGFGNNIYASAATTADSSGYWELKVNEVADLSAFNEGRSLNVNVTARDIAGNSKEENLNYTVYKDTIVSGNSVVITDSTDEGTVNSTEKAKIVGTVEDKENGGSLDSLSISDGNATIILTVSNVTWDENTFTLDNIDVSTLSDGTLTVTAISSDPYGNSATIDNVTVQKDTAVENLTNITDTTENLNDSVINYSEATSIDLDGTVESGSEIKVKFIDESNNEISAIVLNNASASWSIDDTDISTLDDGSITIQTTATDINGNEKVIEEVIVKDTVVSNTSIIIDDGNESFDGNNVVSSSEETAIDIAGILELGSTLNSLVISDGDQSTSDINVDVSSVNLDASGSYNIDDIDISSLLDATLTVTATATDSYGNVKNDINATIIKDTEAKDLTSIDLDSSTNSGRSNSDDTTNQHLLVVNVGLADDVSVNDEVNIYYGTNVVGTAIVDQSDIDADSISVDVSVRAYANDNEVTNISLDATIIDIYGNESVILGSSNDLDLVIDKDVDKITKDPILLTNSDSGSSNSDRITNDSTPTFKVRVPSDAQENDIITLYANDTKTLILTTYVVQSGEAGLDINITVDPSTTSASILNGTSDGLADGTYDVYPVITDLAGNESEIDINTDIEIDATSPDKPIVNGIDNSTGIISGTAEVGTTITLLNGNLNEDIDTGLITVDNSGNWSFDVNNLSSGTYSNIVAKSTDISGNISIKSTEDKIDVYIDNDSVGTLISGVINFDYYNAGGGYDRIAPSSSTNLSDMLTNVKNIEEIDFNINNIDAVLSLSTSDVLAMTDNNNSLKITSDNLVNGDEITLNGGITMTNEAGKWQKGADDGDGYTSYTKVDSASSNTVEVLIKENDVM
jgi:VCBS repeat-containing protein